MVRLVRTKKELLVLREELTQKKLSIGLIPTMGNLHDGHLSLLKASLKENDFSILTIFVNPKQFSPTEDLESYPRTLKTDIEKIEQLSIAENIAVFCPLDDEEIYPSPFMTTISLGPKTQILCGQNRPGHFDGVTTVVYLLLALTTPENAYFGSKDYQQLFLIKQMAKDLLLKTKIHGLPIIRESSGLAMSSRNQYLNKDQKHEALILSQTLKEIAEKIKSAEESQTIIKEKLTDSRWNYLEIRDADTLDEMNDNTRTALIAGALKVGPARLIDNIRIGLENVK